MFELIEIILQALANFVVAIGLAIGIILGFALSYMVYGEASAMLIGSFTIIGGVIGYCFEVFYLDSNK